MAYINTEDGRKLSGPVRAHITLTLAFCCFKGYRIGREQEVNKK